MKKHWVALIILIQLVLLALILWPDAHTKLRVYDILSLGTGYRAKEVCSCLYVLERSEADCKEWTGDISLNAGVHVDAAQKTVTSSYQWLGSAWPLFPSVARFQDERRGCLLQR